MLLDAKTGREISPEQCRGQFPALLRRLARTAQAPYKDALKMAADEIDELRNLAKVVEELARTNRRLDRDIKAALSN